MTDDRMGGDRMGGNRMGGNRMGGNRMGGSGEGGTSPGGDPTVAPPVTELLDVLQRHQGLLPSLAPAVRDALAAVRRAAERSHLVVVGPEGAGKSTLISALAEADVTPTSAFLPGTVAPVHILHGEGAAPGFTVFRASEEPGGPPRADPTDRAGFDGWLLQEHNPENTRRVLRGEVRLRSDLLSGGLRLVDLPGANSVSREVTARTAEDLAGSAFTAVLVSFGRVSIAALADVVRELAESPYEVKVAAIVFNEVAPPPSERLADHLTMRRRSVAEYLLPADADGTLGLARAGIHALHLPSFLPAASAAAAPAAGPRQEEEQWKAFRAEVADRVRRNVASTAASAARYALPLLDTALADRARSIDRSLDGKVPRSEAAALARELTASTRKRLGEVEAASRAADWAEIEPTVLRTAATLRADLDRIRSRITTGLTLPKAEAKKLNDEIEGLLTRAATGLAAEAEAAFERLGAELRAVTEAAVVEYDTRIPLGATGNPGHADSSVSFTVGSYHYQSSGDEFEDLANDGFGGLVAALLPTVWIALIGQHYLGGGHLGHTLRAMGRTRKEIEKALSPDPDTGCAPVWLQVRTRMVERARRETGSLLTGFQRKAVDKLPQTSVRDLTAQRDGIKAARAQLAEWRGRLDSLGGLGGQ
ncbi:dynamin family protein [Streptomyces vilmorinianum]|uniref:dynamin family protein n=1 Tax=Streptomyces vilmorinianum TaxID=3051092 RepID=UPI0010FB3808|nr:dynamin family protein [Streptomyces vilmorinianum]